jgi:hypothetical protein
VNLADEYRHVSQETVKYTYTVSVEANKTFDIFTVVFRICRITLKKRFILFDAMFSAALEVAFLMKSILI